MISLVDFDINIREQMENIRRKANEDVNAKTFCSGYIWAKSMDIKVHLENDMYAMKNNSHGQTAWNFPVGSDESKIRFINKLLSIDGLKLLKLTEEDVAFINKHYSDRFVIEEEPDDSEYIYDAVEHSEMAGETFYNLRKQIRKFNRQHDVKTVPLTKDNMQVAERIMLSWGDVHDARGELNTSGMEIDGFILDHYDELGMIGILIYIDGEPSAVAIGYPISSDMCDITETKFVPSIRNIGYVVVEEFMRTFWNTYRYFNSEEDMGIPGLREYKQCLKPCRMITMWNAYLKGGQK